MAARLREILAVEQQMTLTSVLVAPTPEARSTARVLQDCLAADTPQWAASSVPSVLAEHRPVTRPDWARIPDLPPTGSAVRWTTCERMRPGAPAEHIPYDLDHLENRIAGGLRAGPSDVPRAVALVGHDPQLSLLSTRLHRRPRWRPTRAWRGGVPVQSGEIVCLEVDLRAAVRTDGTRLERLRAAPYAGRTRKWCGRLRWQISPDDSAAETAIRDKIKSKMDLAKQLSAVVTLVLTVVLGALSNKTIWTGLREARTTGGVLIDGQAAVRVALVLLLLALGMHLAALYAYDTLLMPQRFWAAADGKRPRWLPARPPGSTAWVLNRNMQRTWAWLVQPAVLLTVAALVVLALPLLRLGLWEQVAAAVVLAVYLVVVRMLRPAVGSAD